MKLTPSIIERFGVAHGKPVKAGSANRVTTSSTAVTLRATWQWYCTSNGGFYAVLPYPPALNNLYATFNGRRILSREGRAYKKSVAALLAGAKPLTCEVKVSVELYRPRRAGDLDGALKALLDSLSGLLYTDDKQIVELHAVRGDDKIQPRAVLTVDPAGKDAR